jgi:NAD(P)-dependent dehydrogenase (short-subunit alcohol dehydrogenase family)
VTPLAGATVAVTGGARGIGRATAEALARAGARVSIGDLDGDLAGEVARALPGQAHACELDVADRASFQRYLDDTEAALGALSILVNNAGLMHVGRLVDEPDEMTARLLDVNVLGVALGTKLALPRMLARGAGHIVNVASTGGKSAVGGGATYCASKHAVVGLTEALRGELRRTGVAVTVVLPAVVTTELISGLPPIRGTRPIAPARVADAIVRAIERNRYEVFVPRSIGPLVRLLGLLPDAIRERIRVALGADEVLLEADLDARAGYVARTMPATRDPSLP